MSEWIHVNSVIDDFGLTSEEFRVYAHLAGRRASSDGVAWPAVTSVAFVCRLHRDTVYRVLRSLESKGLVVRESVRGRANRYRFPSPQSIQIPTVLEGSPLETGLPVSKGQGVMRFEGQGVQCFEGHEGIPKKGVHKSIPSPAGAGAEVTPKKDRPRDLIFEALAIVDNVVINDLTEAGRGKLNKAQSAIVKASPNVTPEEIARRCAILRQMLPRMPMSALALSSHWARCSSAPIDPNSYAAALKRQQDEDRAEAAAKAAREAGIAANPLLNASLPSWA